MKNTLSPRKKILKEMLKSASENAIKKDIALEWFEYLVGKDDSPANKQNVSATKLEADKQHDQVKFFEYLLEK